MSFFLNGYGVAPPCAHLFQEAFAFLYVKWSCIFRRLLDCGGWYCSRVRDADEICNENSNHWLEYDPQTVLKCSISEPTHPHLFVVWTHPSWICGLAHLKLNWEEATEENAEPVQVRAVVAAGSVRCWLDSWNMQLKYAANNHNGNKLINNKRKLQFYRCVLKEEPCLYSPDTVPNMLLHYSASFLDFLERLCCGVMSLQEGSRFKFFQGQGLFCIFSHISA